MIFYILYIGIEEIRQVTNDDGTVTHIFFRILQIQQLLFSSRVNFMLAIIALPFQKLLL